MVGTDKRKQSLYFPVDMLEEIQKEADRQDRSLSWIVQQAWRLAREQIALLPSDPFAEERIATQAQAFARGKFDSTGT